MTTRKKRNIGLFFFVRNLGQSSRKIPQKLEMYFVDKKNTFSKTANVTLFRINTIMKNNPANFRFPTLLQSTRNFFFERKSFGCRWNQLVVFFC